MAYSELIKNFDNIRNYMKEFFIYGFKTRDEYNMKSARSYDNERRRIQSYLGDAVSFKKTSTGKNMFISLDGRSVTHNPLYRAFKAKSFTNKDITLHFILMDIFADGNLYTHNELLDAIETEYLSHFKEPMSFDESTVRKKLKEYCELGFIINEKEGRTVRYRRAEDAICLRKYRDAIRFFTEENILGVVGSYLEDKYEAGSEFLMFKNHYIMNAYDTEVIYLLLQAIHEKRQVKINNFSPRSERDKTFTVIPVKIYVSTQGGRSYLICKKPYCDRLFSYRIDYIKAVELNDAVEGYGEIIKHYDYVKDHMWGVVCNDEKKLEHIEMDIFVGADEEFIIRRLERERRCGSVERIDDNTYRFSADVFDTYEMIPWIRSFFGRIKRIKCSNDEVIGQLKYDMVKMAKQYEGLE